MKKTGLSIIVALATLMSGGCSFLDVEPVIVTADTFYDSADKIQLGLNGVYGVMNSEYFYGKNYTVYMSNCDDLCYYGGTTSGLTYQTVAYTHSSTSSEIYQVWTYIYAGIMNANYLMDDIADSEYDPDHKYYNEARFMRAFYHFLLAQTWGDVPLRDKAVTSPTETSCPATSQLEVLQWVASEMEACLDLLDEEWVCASTVNKGIALGMLARVYLWMAGENVEGNEAYKHEYYGKAMEYADLVIKSGLYQLNPDYAVVFQNMIGDKYDTEYRESMWEADFVGTAADYSNFGDSRIGDLLGLYSVPTDYTVCNCNHSTSVMYGSLKLFNLYWAEDRTEDEYEQADTLSDARQVWNMRAYNYKGSTSYAPWPEAGSGTCLAGIDKTPYVFNGVTTSQSPLAAKAIRNCGKWSREVIYEGLIGDSGVYNGCNFPILRYSDILLMYAEASNEYYGAPTQEAYDCVKQVRDRAGIQTKDFSDYDYDTFQQFVRNERGRELCFEALRKYDLIRWGILVEAMHGYVEDSNDPDWTGTFGDRAAAIGARVEERHNFMPIPLVELGVNTELKQNPLW